MRTSRNQIAADDRIARMSSDERGARGYSEADISRTNERGTMLTVEDDIEMSYDPSEQTVLPKAPDIPGYHTVWLSFDSKYDPLNKRLNQGYSVVKSEEIPGFESVIPGSSGGADSSIRCNEMILCKTPISGKTGHLARMFRDHHARPYQLDMGLRAESEKHGEKVEAGLADGFAELGEHRRASFEA